MTAVIVPPELYFKSGYLTNIAVPGDSILIKGPRQEGKASTAFSLLRDMMEYSGLWKSGEVRVLMFSKSALASEAARASTRFKKSFDLHQDRITSVSTTEELLATESILIEEKLNREEEFLFILIDDADYIMTHQLGHLLNIQKEYGAVLIATSGHENIPGIEPSEVINLP